MPAFAEVLAQTARESPATAGREDVGILFSSAAAALPAAAAGAGWGSACCGSGAARTRVRRPSSSMILVPFAAACQSTKHDILPKPATMSKKESKPPLLPRFGEGLWRRLTKMHGLISQPPYNCQVCMGCNATMLRTASSVDPGIPHVSRGFKSHRGRLALAGAAAANQEGGAATHSTRNTPTVPLDQLLRLIAPERVQHASDHKCFALQALRVASRHRLQQTRDP